MQDAGHGPLITQKTGLLLDSYFSGTKIYFIQGNRDFLMAEAFALRPDQAWTWGALAGGIVLGGLKAICIRSG